MDKKTESLNQSGIFLQFHILKELTKRGWIPENEFPRVVAPFVSNPMDKRDILYRNDPDRLSAEKYPDAVIQSQDLSNRSETSLDVYAIKQFSIFNQSFVMRLCIESKKNDPRFIDWCFFQLEPKNKFLQTIKVSTANTGHTTLMKIGKTSRLGDEIWVQTDQYPKLPFLKYTVSDFAIALKDKMVETDYYKSEKTVIDSSMRQIIKGTYGAILELVDQQVISGQHYSVPPDVFIPIIVTNANLFLCKFNPEDIDPSSAQILKDPTYESVDSIIYQYPKPKEVQFPEPLFTNLDPIRRIDVLKWHVLICNPTGFVNFLDQLETLPTPASNEIS